MLGQFDVEHTFTVELKSKKDVKNISISNDTHDRVLFEGNLGELKELSLVEGDVLEFIGKNGVLRITLTIEHLKKVLKQASKVKPQRPGETL